MTMNKLDWSKIAPEFLERLDNTRYYFTEGDVVTLANRATILIMQDGINEFDVLVLKKGFGMKKGDIQTIPLRDLPHVKKEDFVSLPFQAKTNPFLPWEAGDIVEDKGNLLALMKESEDKTGFYAMLLQTSSKNKDIQSQIGGRFYVPRR